jgi:hypothetical protein
VRVLPVTIALVVCSALVNPTSAEQPVPLSRAAAHIDTVRPAGGPDSAGLDEMLRGDTGQARHWPGRPDLVVLTAVLDFDGGVQRDYVATNETITPVEAEEIARDLAEGLAVLSGGAFREFASVRVESARPGDRIGVMRDGVIVAARFRGIARALKAVGFGGRLARPDGTITSGTVMLDSAYDRTDRLRRLLRIHELGHALGYNHVTSRRSIMNPTLGSEPTEFDHRAALAAFAH